MTRNGRQLARARAASGHAEAQRVDNCKVPLDLRGPKPRPAECDDGASTRSKQMTMEREREHLAQVDQA